MADLALAQKPDRVLISRERVSRAMGSVRPYLYLAPFIIVLGVFTFWPLLQVVLLSFQTWNLNPDIPSRFVGFDNYRGVFSSSLFGAALVNTAIYLIAAIPLKVILPLPVAIFIWSLGSRGETYRVIVFLPTLISFVAASVAWVWLLSPLGGYLAVLLEAFGIRMAGLSQCRHGDLGPARHCDVEGLWLQCAALSGGADADRSFADRGDADRRRNRRADRAGSDRTDARAVDRAGADHDDHLHDAAGLHADRRADPGRAGQQPRPTCST